MFKRLALIVSVIFVMFLSTARANESDVLQTLGAFVASDLICTYTAINAVSDLYAYGKYPTDQTKTIIMLQQSMIKNKKEGLANLIKTGDFVGEDIDFANTAIGIYDDLEQQTVFFLKYVDSHDQKDADSFQYYRKQAWDKISKLLNLQ